MFAAYSSLHVNGIGSVVGKWSVRGPSNPLVWRDNAFAATVDVSKKESLVVGVRALCVGAEPNDNENHESHPHRDDKPSNLKRLLEAYECGTSPTFFGKLRSPAFIGGFGFVIWNLATRELLAVRDPLGVSCLFYKVGPHDILVSDSLDAFEPRPCCDESFVTDFIVSRGSWAQRTIWSGILPIPAGTIVRWQSGQLRIERYWAPEILTTLARIDAHEATREFRRLTDDAVSRCLDPDRQTWAQLSGGLDSSSVVSTAAMLTVSGATQRELAGVITYTDSLGTGDETFAEAVVERYRLRQEQIADYWPWRDDGEPPPVTDQPARDYPLYARDRLFSRIIKSAGGKSVLSGIGPDHYLARAPHYIADLLWCGRVAESGRQLARWTIATRQSLWRTTWRHVFVPLALRRMYVWSPDPFSGAPSWFTRRFAKRHDLRQRFAAWQARAFSGSRGHFYESAVAWQLSTLAATLAAWSALRQVEVKHPLLHLPLVEFCLRLPYGLRTDPSRPKAILRAAMEGVVPDCVRQRVSKGVISPRVCWAFTKERDFLFRLLAEPVLADIGCIEPRALLSAIDQSATGPAGNTSTLYAVLALESWLSMKSGRRIGYQRLTRKEVCSYGEPETSAR